MSKKKTPRRALIIPLAEKLAQCEKIRTHCRIVGTCWLCNYRPNSSGYPIMKFHGQRFVVPRFMLAEATHESYDFPYYALHSEVCAMQNGPIIGRTCVNPAHLHWGDTSQNAAEREHVKRKKTLEEMRGVGVTNSEQSPKGAKKLVTRSKAKLLSTLNAKWPDIRHLDPPIEA